MALTVGSLLLWLAAAGLWVRGYRVADVVYVRSPVSGNHFMFASSRGRLGVFVTPYPPDRIAAGERFVYARRRPGELIRKGGHFRNFRSRFGVQAAWTTGRPERAASVPVWWLLVPATPLPAIWLRGRVRRAVRRRRGLCPACGYDLRATTDARCPECGTATQPRTPP